MIGLIGLLFLVGMELYEPESLSSTPWLSDFKILISFGFAMSVVGMFLENSSVFPIDVYFRGSDHVEFRNFVPVSLAKAAITLVGVIFFGAGLYLEPETPSEEKNVGYYISFIIGGLFGLGLLRQIIVAMRNLYWNRGDFIHLSANTIKWYDNEVKVLKEFRVRDIRFFTKKFEGSDKSPSLAEIHLHPLNGTTESISLKTMSLIPQGEIIISELKKVIAEGQNDTKIK
jgi:hypothetical protein